MLNGAQTLPGRLRPVVDEQEFFLDGVLDVAKSATRIAFFFLISPPTYSSFTAQQRQLLFRLPRNVIAFKHLSLLS